MAAFNRAGIVILPAFWIVLMAMTMTVPAQAEPLSLQALVTPSTVVASKDGHPITFALHGFVEFKSLSEMFSYIDAQNRRWKSNAEISGGINEEQRQAVMRDLLRRGVESRVVSMVDEGPLETLVTHTRAKNCEQRWRPLKNRFLRDMPTLSLRYRKSGSTH